MEGRVEGLEEGDQGGDLGGIREQGEWLREAFESVKRELRERKGRWLEEKGELERRIRKLESRDREGGGDRKIRGEKQKDEGTVERIKEIERKIEIKEREERRKNVVMKEIKVRKGKRKEAVEEILKDIGIKGRIEGVRKLRGNVEKKTDIWVRLENEKQRRKVMEKKKKLRGRKERIMEDLTWKERKMRWKLEGNSERGREER